MSKRMTKARQRAEIIHGAWKCYQHACYAASSRVHKLMRATDDWNTREQLRQQFDARYPAPSGYFDCLGAGEIWTQNTGTVVRFRDEHDKLLCSYEVRDGAYRRIH